MCAGPFSRRSAIQAIILFLLHRILVDNLPLPKHSGVCGVTNWADCVRLGLGMVNPREIEIALDCSRFSIYTLYAMAANAEKCTVESSHRYRGIELELYFVDVGSALGFASSPGLL